MKSLSINGYKLHEIKMLLLPYSTDSVSYLLYPKQRILYETHEDELTLRIPAKLALEIFRTGIMSQNQDAEINLSISGKKIGTYFITDFRYPNNHTEIITIVFKKHSLKRRRTKTFGF